MCVGGRSVAPVVRQEPQVEGRVGVLRTERVFGCDDRQVRKVDHLGYQGVLLRDRGPRVVESFADRTVAAARDQLGVERGELGDLGGAGRSAGAVVDVLEPQAPVDDGGVIFQQRVGERPIPRVQLLFPEQLPAVPEIFEERIGRLVGRVVLGADEGARLDVEVGAQQIERRASVDDGAIGAHRGGQVLRVARQAREGAELHNVGADLGEITLGVADRTGPQVCEAVRRAARRFGEADQQAVCEIARAVEHEPFAGREVAGLQAGDHANHGFEHLHRTVDVEIEMRAQPLDAQVQLVVELHHVERVEGFDDREPDRVSGHEEVGGRARDGLDFVRSPREALVAVPRVEKLVAHLPGHDPRLRHRRVGPERAWKSGGQCRRAKGGRAGDEVSPNRHSRRLQVSEL